MNLSGKCSYAASRLTSIAVELRHEMAEHPFTSISQEMAVTEALARLDLAIVTFRQIGIEDSRK